MYLMPKGTIKTDLAMTLANVSTLPQAPPSFDWRTHKGAVTPVKDQGQCGWVVPLALVGTPFSPPPIAPCQAACHHNTTCHHVPTPPTMSCHALWYLPPVRPHDICLLTARDVLRDAADAARAGPSPPPRTSSLCGHCKADIP